MLTIASGQWQLGAWSPNVLDPSLDSERTLVIIFGASRLESAADAVTQLAAIYPQSTFIGCSTAGEILNDEVFDNSLVVSIAKFEHTDLKVAYAPIAETGDSYSAGAHLASKFDPEGLSGVFVLSNGHSVNGSAFVRGIADSLPANTVITGGLAGDGDSFEKTWILENLAPNSGSVCAVGFYGDQVHVGHGCESGWDKFGVERRITKSEGNVLYELDGMPALDLYKRYLGDQARELPAASLLFPLAVRMDSDSDEQVIRTVLHIDEEQKAMIFAGDVPEGALSQFMMGNMDKLIDSAGIAACRAVDTMQTVQPVLSIAVSCVGRRLILQQRAEDELESALEAFPDGSSQLGFYSYGELSPDTAGVCTLHNQTMTITTISEN